MFEYNEKGNQEIGCITLLFLGWDTSCEVGVGVGVDIFRPESESLKIRQFRSPGTYALLLTASLRLMAHTLESLY